MIPPQHIKAYVRGNKNDYGDARAVAEAACRPDISFVTVKSVEQQDEQALHRLREAQVGECMALCNQVRGLLSELVKKSKAVARASLGVCDKAP